ncbi:MAG: carbohydrate-binding protein [Fibrobacter sp.]|jgi:hypothetical protein|nr:carbohydrate-binding protein [Fibrobacter sp.]
MNIWAKIAALSIATLFSGVFAAPNPNFHIYLAYGQSNMAGAGGIENGDQVPHDRFLMISGVDCNSRKGNTDIKLSKGKWAKAVPPMFHCYEGLSVADYFGRYMADSLPGITIGIIPVAVGGTSIKLFDKDQWQSYYSTAADWLQSWAKDYDPDGNNYKAIIALGKKAMEVGVIKGVIFHQGESDGGDDNWKRTVHKTYADMLNEWGLAEEDVPFVAGEMLQTSNACCGSKNGAVNGLKDYFKKFGVASSQGLGGIDVYHFDHNGYVTLGKRYAEQMLKLIDRTVDPNAPPVDVEDPNNSTVPDEPPEEYGPYNNVIQIPGTVEAENYNKGGAGVAYSDMDKTNQGTQYRGDQVDIYMAGMGMAVGYTEATEWMKYSINVTEAGEYDISANVSGTNGTGSFVLYIDDTRFGDEIIAPVGPDYDTYVEVSGGKVNLTAGAHELKLEINNNWINIDWVKFTKTTTHNQINTKLSSNLAQTFDGIYTVYGLSGTQIGIIQLDKANLQTVKQKVLNLTRDNGMFLLKNSSHSFVVNIKK